MAYGIVNEVSPITAFIAAKNISSPPSVIACVLRVNLRLHVLADIASEPSLAANFTDIQSTRQGDPVTKRTKAARSTKQNKYGVLSR